MTEVGSGDLPDEDLEEFKPVGTIAVVVLFVIALILLWLSVYIILLTRGATA